MFRLQRLEITGFKSFADYTELVFTGDGITAVVGPNGCGKCVSGDTLVTLADGRDVPIRELVESALQDSRAVETLNDGTLTRENPHGCEIISLNPATLRLEPRPVAAFVKREATPHLLRIRTRSGREVKATPYHPLFTLDGGQLRALKAEELKVGVRLALPRRLPVTGAENKLPAFDALKRFGDNDRVYVPFSASLKRWTNETRSEFGTFAEWARVAGTSPRQLKSLRDGQSIGTAALTKLFKVTQRQPSLDRRFKLNGAAAAILRLTFVGNKQPAVEVLRQVTPALNPNHDLIPGAASLVKEAAARAKVKIKANRSECPKLAAYVEQRCEASRGGLLEVVEQIERLGAQPEEARPVLNRLSVLATSDVYWDEIVSIDEVPPPDEWVYDLSVAGTHNFVAGNIVVHNSNVADAISWVLGEQRVKQLRGAEMKDVIFQGARNRAASGMAEVVLHLVRDETIEEEPDIDDIDSALEEIDEQSEAVEEKLSPETLGEAAVSLSDENVVTAVDATASLAGVSGTAQSVETQNPASEVAGDSTAPDTATDGAHAGKSRHKRHWRPRRMALEFGPGETVSVTRRLYRSGESEYLLNGRQCRLRDIQDLFSGTGLAGAHYAIIEQGRIGQILSAKPMDRRTLVEEAAGITKFRVRQRAAEARLEGARANLHRVSDIVSEIERQAGSLRRQAAKARRYAQLREELRDLLRRVYVADERSLVALLGDLQTRLGEMAEEERSLTAALEAGEEEARRATGEAREIEDQLSVARADVAESALRSDRRERERAYQQEQAASLAERSAGIVREIENLRARAAQVEAECEALRAVEVQVRDAGEETTRLLEAAEAAHAGRVAEVLDAETKIEVARAELLTHTAVAERLMEIGRQLDSALERLAAQAEGLEREGERAAGAYEAAKIAAENLQAEIVEGRARLDAHIAERGEAAREVAGARDVVAETAAAHERVRDEAARVRHRLDTLAELDAQHALYSQAVQRIFSPASPDEAPKDFHSIATLADVLRVEPRWERAVESIFGSYLQGVIVPTPDDAVRAAAWLQTTGAGRATFLVAGLQGGGPEGDDPFGDPFGRAAGASLIEDAAEDDGEAIGTRVGDLLGAPREIAAVLARTLPREVNARVVKDLDQAMARSLATGEMFVTARGEWVAGGQLLAAGGPVSAGEGAGLLAFKREMRDLEAGYTGLEADLLFAEQAAGRARERLGQLEDAYVLLNEVIGREEREHDARELTGRQLAQEIERAGRHMRVVADDAARLDEERRALEERGSAQKAEAAAAEGARLAAARAVAGAAELLAAARRAAEEESERLGKQRSAAAAAAERRRATTAELKRMEAEGGDLRDRLERHTEELRDAESRLAELRRSITQMDEGAGQIDDERAAYERRVEQVAGRLVEARERADACSARLTDLRHQAAAVRDARGTLDVERAEAGARLNYVREACVHDLAQTPEELSRLSEPEEDFDLESERARVEEMRVRLEGFGAVNMMALEELAEAEERLQFLTTQRQDITDGIISTEEALREIKRRSRERFRHAFEEINRNFGQFFVELFGGGRGEMSLLDADDVLESGIDIIAQPPGKRLQNVLLLSGGEKAMAALALVLAVFRYRPSPFCLLDEVDAPLDEANIGRFTSKVTEMSADTQFIVITHNKRTMEVARALYGVTMEDAGVSKLVSVRFE